MFQELKEELTYEDLTKSFIKMLVHQYQHPSSEKQRERALSALKQARKIASSRPGGGKIHQWILEEGVALEEVAFAQPESKKARGYL